MVSKNLSTFLGPYPSRREKRLRARLPGAPRARCTPVGRLSTDFAPRTPAPSAMFPSVNAVGRPGRSPIAKGPLPSPSMRPRKQPNRSSRGRAGGFRCDDSPLTGPVLPVMVYHPADAPRQSGQLPIPAIAKLNGQSPSCRPRATAIWAGPYAWRPRRPTGPRRRNGIPRDWS